MTQRVHIKKSLNKQVGARLQHIPLASYSVPLAEADLDPSLEEELLLSRTILLREGSTTSPAGQHVTIYQLLEEGSGEAMEPVPDSQWATGPAQSNIAQQISSQDL